MLGGVEILELIVGMIDVCGCFFEVFVAIVDVWTGAKTVKHVRDRKDGAAPASAGLITLVVFAVLVTVLVAVKWVTIYRRGS